MYHELIRFKLLNLLLFRRCYLHELLLLLFAKEAFHFNLTILYANYLITIIYNSIVIYFHLYLVQSINKTN